MLKQIQIFLLIAGIHASWSYLLPHWHSVLKNSRSQLLATTEKVDKSSLPSPGAPVVQSSDKDNLLAKILLAVPGSVTQSAFSEACKLFNEEVKRKGYTIPGFRPGATLAAPYLFKIFGEEQVLQLSFKFMGNAIQSECEKVNLETVGRGRILDYRLPSFVPGESHVFEVEVDLWPEITYADGGYRGLSVNVTQTAEDQQKMNAVKENIREKFIILQDTTATYQAKLGDVLMVNMRGFEKDGSGNKGAALPSIASGDEVEIILEKGKFMEGMVESLVGGKTGEKKEVTVKFPVRAKGPGAAVSGKEAIFEIEIKSIKTRALPAWDETLAARVRPGLDLKGLEEEVKKAVEGDAANQVETNRNDALAKALLARANIPKLPESVVEEETATRFNNMLMDFREQGSTPEQLAEMETPEAFARYKEVSRGNVEKVVKLGLIFRDIATKEKLVVEPKEIQEQIDVLQVQAKQKGEQVDVARAREEIENVLLRRKVFDFIAQHATVTYLDPVPATPPTA